MAEGHPQLTSTPSHAMRIRLLREPTPALNGLPGRWLAALLERVRAPGQGRDNIVRRSGGLPFAFVALFLAEPVGSHKVRRRRCLFSL